ncbi:4877_t:CDS:2 [Gigaspora rosea]|nr:4877_t:CDS:2 [Gigaspora rosea]
MIKRANEVKNIHFLTLVLNCFDDPFIFLFVSLVCKLWKQIVETHDFWESFCNQLGINGPNPHAHKYKTYHSIYLKNLNHLYTSCRKDFGERQTSIKKIKFKLDVLNDYYEKDLYIEKYGGVVKNWDFPKNLLYNRNFSYDKKEEENPYAELEHASARAHYLAELGIFGNLESDSKTDSNENELASE